MRPDSEEKGVMGMARMGSLSGYAGTVETPGPDSAHLLRFTVRPRDVRCGIIVDSARWSWGETPDQEVVI